MGQYDCGYGAWIPGPLLDDPGLRPRSLILYARIARRANRVGFCYATNATLIDDMTAADEDGSVRVLSERTIQAMLAELQDRGHIRTDTGPLPADKSGIVRTGRRIYIGRALAEIPDASGGGEENFTPEKICTQRVKKSSPPIICRKEEDKKIPPKVPQKGDEFEAMFERFYSAYPRHLGKAAAHRAWMRLKPTADLLKRMAAALNAQKQSESWQRENGRYIPYPATWLNQRRWEDELPTAEQSTREAGDEDGI